MCGTSNPASQSWDQASRTSPAPAELWHVPDPREHVLPRRQRSGTSRTSSTRQSARGWERPRRFPGSGTVGGTRHTYSLWLEWGLDLLALQLVPVDVAEERVLLDVPLPLRAAAQALGRVLGHQLGTGERKQSRGVQLLPKMSPLRSPQGAVFPSWTSQDVSHQGPISSRCLWDSKERTLRKKLE